MSDTPDSEAALQSFFQARRHQLFPALTAAQVELMSKYGERRRFPADHVLFTQGERHISMYVIVAGTIQIERGTALRSRALGTFGEGMFTGDIGTLAGRAAVATAITQTECEMIVVDEECLRALVVAEADLSELIMRAYILRRVAFIQDKDGSGVIVFGSRQSAHSLNLREFLSRNGQPAAYFEVEQHESAAALMERFDISLADIPAVVTPGSVVLKKPNNRELADALGMSADNLNGKQFDLAVVGAGPAGLAAAVYGASEGLSVVVLDTKAAGGQAGTSSKIENYFGFPTGISGVALAGRGLSQARKFGAEVAVPIEVTSLDCRAGKTFDIALDNGEHIQARSVVIATGARYRKPSIHNLERYEGRGIYYNASFMEATFCTNEDVILVGGGNSAGQAAVFLAGHARHVHIMVRSSGLAASMSQYLIQRIDAAPNITLHTHTQIVDLKGEDKLQCVMCQTRDATPKAFNVEHVFLFLGAEPNTSWLNKCVKLDDKEFVLTGPQVQGVEWPLERPPHHLETSNPGIFAVGDVRSGSVKRVAAAVGEGSAAIQALHQFLAES
ncbi:MAG: FAD-dependent oxidoreductase [Herminiimonas sp.]|uniref:FAD-dependent oxidoreductase n=1 Tax=Herminiimonas sp. TaxID=1926289 RepID=UPI00272176FB|nr:FAD-dependent oxidoreductase [Herminiimonas sp.]MDO9419227.1 FAD-dependent oxidoreductase [Herminiimonas sp.]